MEVGYNNDTAYFSLSGDIMKGIEQDVVSLTVEEELKKFRTGSIVMRDESGLYSRFFRNGRTFDLEWGYRNPFGWGVLNPGQPFVRKGAKCVIQQPSGSGDENGETRFTASFFATEILKTKEYQVHTSGSLYGVVEAAFNRLGIVLHWIDFERKDESVTLENSVRQISTTYEFLFKLSQKYRAFLQIGENKEGVKIGAFISYKNPAGIKNFLEVMTGSVNINDKELHYNYGDKSNVRSFNWTHNVGDSGGDEVQLMESNGETIMVHRHAETMKVTYYKLNEVKLTAAIKDKTDFQSKSKFMQWALEVNDFEQIKPFFDAVQTTTAPQGMGFTINVSMIGDPALTPCRKVIFKNGFPSPLQKAEGTPALSDFYIRKAVHSITKGSYTTELEIADLYTINGSLITELADVGHWQNG